MDEDGAPARERERRLHARGRARRWASTPLQEAVDQNAESARRLIEGDELLTSSELARAKAQLEIRREHKAEEEWHDAELTQWNERNRIRNARAWIMTTSLAFCVAWGIGALLYGEVTIIPPSELWSWVRSIG